MIKLVACDIDGTLLKGGNKEMSPEVVSALGKLVAGGKKVVLASGRSYTGIRNLTKDMPFADELYYICNDGAICMYRDKVLYHKQISIENLLKFDRFPAYQDLATMYYSDTFSYVTKSTPEFLDMLEADGIDRLDPISGIYDIKAPIYKIGVYNKAFRPEKLLPEPFDLRVCYASQTWIEYTSRFADKGLALSDLQMRLYLAKFDTAVLGDGENDIAMFAKAKYSFARRDGNESLVRAATDTFTDVTEVLEALCDK